jgi:hypothetical protein
MLAMVLFLFGTGSEQETSLGVLNGLIWQSDAISSQHRLIAQQNKAIAGPILAERTGVTDL